MCWASNHQNIYKNGPRAHFPFNDNTRDMCGMVSYTISDKKFVTNAIRVRLVPYSTCDYLYLHPTTFVSVFVSEDIRI
jgi:hypothetical protein